MSEELFKLCQELKEIKTYLIKIGPTRRQGSILNKKLEESRNIYSKYLIVSEKITYDIKKGYLGQDIIKLVNKLLADFDSLYKQVLQLCNQSEINFGSSSSSETVTMSSFELKTALSLLPVMTDELHITRQLIDAIEYYETTLKDTSKPELINFVLKSRLSQSAKLRLALNYDSVSELVKDMKKVLLPQKSATSLQNQLLTCKQNNMSLIDYGNKITELFTELTISQSDGNEENFKVLKPLNEKQAIKSFADGLRNRRLNTIILARNYNCLKDAIQAAVDEEVSHQSTSQEMLTFRNSTNYYAHNNRYFRNQSTRGRFNRGGFHHHHQPQGAFHSNRGSNQRFQSRGRHRGFMRGSQGRNVQEGGKSNYNNHYRGGNRPQQHRQIHMVTEPNEQEQESEFFRD